MNYELARRLKEAGFPQKGLIWVSPEGYQSCDCGTCRVEDQDPDKDNDVYVPTLSELIAACGYEGFVMWELDGKLYAGKDPGGCRGEIYYDDYPDPLAEGLIPEEAVANLWLAINSKNNDRS